MCFIISSKYMVQHFVLEGYRLLFSVSYNNDWIFPLSRIHQMPSYYLYNSAHAIFCKSTKCAGIILSTDTAI